MYLTKKIHSIRYTQTIKLIVLIYNFDQILRSYLLINLKTNMLYLIAIFWFKIKINLFIRILFFIRVIINCKRQKISKIFEIKILLFIWKSINFFFGKNISKKIFYELNSLFWEIFNFYVFQWIKISDLF